VRASTNTVRQKALKLEIHIDTKRISAALTDEARKQMPFVTANMLSKLAIDAQAALQKEMPVAFDRPTPFTVNGIFTKRAEKTNLVAEVFVPNSQDERGKAQREYLRPGVQGASARNQKKTEFLLTRAGVLPAGWVTVPGKWIKAGKLDAYGNMPGSYYKQIIRELQIRAPEDRYFKPRSAKGQQSAKKMGVEGIFFAVKPGANTLGKNGGYLPSGVYKRSGAGGRKLLQYLKFIRRAAYRPRLDVLDVVSKAVQDNAQARFNEAVALVTNQFKAR